jgi:hypothetical protein
MVLRVKRQGKDGRIFLMGDHSPLCIWEKGDHDKDLQLHLPHIWPGDKARPMGRPKLEAR